MAREQRRLAAIVAADVVGYSRLMERDESATLARLREHRKQRFAPTLVRYGGRLVKLTGDGALVEFPSAVDALAAAIEFQQVMGEVNQNQPADARIVFRIGLHLGDLIVDGDDLYGDGVNIAARLEAEAPPGGIVVSRTVHEAVVGRLKATFEDLGNLALKNINRPVQAFGVKWSASDWKVSPPMAGTPAIDVSPPHTEVSLALPDKPSIAVLPFANMSGDVDQEYFADGMTEDVITELSRFRDLFIIARNSTFSYKGKAMDVRQVARELGVRYVLEGSVRKAGNRVRVTAQLIDALNGAHLWAERYDRVLEDIFAVQEDLTRNIVIAVAPAVESADIEQVVRAKPADLQAYGLAQKAWFAFDGGNASAQAPRDEAMALATRALSRDPLCVLAMNVLSSCHWFNGFYGTATFEESLRLGLSFVQKALVIDPRNHTSHLFKGYVLHAQGQFEQAIASHRQAHEVNPNDARGMAGLGWVEACVGDTDAGIPHLLASLRHDPKSPYSHNTYVMLSMACFVAKDHVQGLKWALRAAAERSDWPPALHQTMVHQIGLGQMSDARKTFAVLKRVAPTYVRVRLDGQGFRAYERPEDRERSRNYLLLVAGDNAGSAK